ncbi:aldose 1-epimerase [Nannochloropsis oceanica]
MSQSTPPYAIKRISAGLSGPPDTAVHSFEVSNGSLSISMMDYGATLISVRAPDRDGKLDNVTLFSNKFGKNEMYMGVTVGRVANRVANGMFKLDGKDYTLATNNGPNSLHGGIQGFDKRMWEGKTFKNDKAVGVIFTLHSPDGDEGYPGFVTVQAIYSILIDQDVLEMDFRAETDAATPINLSNHAYWNLGGEDAGGKHIRKAHDHFLHVNASHILEVGPNQIPTGVLQPVEGTPFDLRDGSGSQLGNRIPLIDGGGKPGFDHCYVIEEYDPAASRRVTSTKGGKKEKGENVDKRKQAEAQGEMMEEEEEREEGKSIRNQARYMASLTEKESGRVMHVYGTQPGLQIYTANWLSEEKGEQHGAVCLETEFFPNAINDPTEGAAESVVLRPGQVYRHFTYHVFQTIPRERE